eukprot:3587956-Pleurochrysis_carterae.AAC.2
MQSRQTPEEDGAVRAEHLQEPLVVAREAVRLPRQVRRLPSRLRLRSICYRPRPVPRRRLLVD